MRKTYALLSALLLIPGCVSVEGPAMTKGEMQKGQRTILLVFAAPTPVMTAEESNVATAVDIIPGVGQLAQSVRDDRNTAVSQDLARALPAPWDPAAEFAPKLRAELDRAGSPGTWMMPSETEIIPDRLVGWNQADNVADWTMKYYGLGPMPPAAPRNYSRIPGISDALIFEANLSWGLDADADGNQSPFLACRARLYAAATGNLLWSQEELLPDGGFKGSLETLKPNGDQLETHWRALMPPLAAKLADDFRKSLLTAGLYAGPALSTAPPAGALPAAAAYSLTGSTAPAATAYTLPPTAPVPAPAPAPAANPLGLQNHP